MGAENEGQCLGLDTDDTEMFPYCVLQKFCIESVFLCFQGIFLSSLQVKKDFNKACHLNLQLNSYLRATLVNVQTMPRKSVWENLKIDRK